MIDHDGQYNANAILQRPSYSSVLLLKGEEQKEWIR